MDQGIAQHARQVDAADTPPRSPRVRSPEVLQARTHDWRRTLMAHFVVMDLDGLFEPCFYSAWPSQKREERPHVARYASRLLCRLTGLTLPSTTESDQAAYIAANRKLRAQILWSKLSLMGQSLAYDWPTHVHSGTDPEEISIIQENFALMTSLAKVVEVHLEIRNLVVQPFDKQINITSGSIYQKLNNISANIRDVVTWRGLCLPHSEIKEKFLDALSISYGQPSILISFIHGVPYPPTNGAYANSSHGATAASHGSLASQGTHLTYPHYFSWGKAPHVHKG